MPLCFMAINCNDMRAYWCVGKKEEKSHNPLTIEEGDKEDPCNIRPHYAAFPRLVRCCMEVETIS